MPEQNPSPTPERALYGFTLYISSFVFCGLYLLWAYVPDRLLVKTGLLYLPDKFWAIAIPFLACFLFIAFMVVYFSVNLIRSYVIAGEITEYSYSTANNVLPIKESDDGSVPGEIKVAKLSFLPKKTVCLVKLVHSNKT